MRTHPYECHVRVVFICCMALCARAIWLSQCDISRCSAHGACSDGGCACFNSGPYATDDPLETLGHWKGDTCNMCVDGWLPPPGSKSPISQCTIYCGPQTCNGHGSCGNETFKCECYMSNTLGYWNPDTNCSTCYSGFEGTNCQYQTQSSPPPKCSCFALGRCNNSCACFGNETAGFFSGDKCDKCAESYYPDPSLDQKTPCTNLCKAAACKASALGLAACDSKGACGCSVSMNCGGHGVCKYTSQDGPRCTCSSDDTNGHWDGPSCAVCSEGYAGESCRRIGSIILSTNKTNGSVVGCDDNNANCSGRGYCDINYQMCVCREDLGHWEPLTNCSTCSVGWTGPNCTTDFKTEVLVVNTQSESKSSTLRVLWILVGFAVGMGVMLIFVAVLCVKWKLAKREIVATETALSPDPGLDGLAPKPILGNPAFSFLVSPLSSPLASFNRDTFAPGPLSMGRGPPPYPYSEYSISAARVPHPLSNTPPRAPPKAAMHQSPSPEHNILPNPARSDAFLAESPFKVAPPPASEGRFRNHAAPPLPFDKLVIPPMMSHSPPPYRERSSRSPSLEHHPSVSLSLKSPPRPPHSKSRK